MRLKSQLKSHVTCHHMFYVDDPPVKRALDVGLPMESRPRPMEGRPSRQLGSPHLRDSCQYSDLCRSFSYYKR
jgi:hypothetical protein